MTKKIFYLILISLLFSCQKDNLEEFVPLDSTGEKFMEIISSYKNWQTDWNKITKLGTPLSNEADIVFFYPEKKYYIIPIANDKEITHVAIYSLNLTAKNEFTAASPTIINKDNAKNNMVIQNLLSTEIPDNWDAKGYSTNFKKSDNAIKGKTTLSKSGMPRYHSFGFVIWWHIYATGEEFYRSMLRVQEYVDFYVYQYRLSGISFSDQGSDQSSYINMLFPADHFRWSEASFIFSEFCQNIITDIRGISGVTNVYIEIKEQSEWIDNQGGDSGGGGGGGEESPNPNIQNGQEVLDSICNFASTTLTPEQLEQLKNAFDELINIFPEIKQMVNHLSKISMKLSFHIGSVSNGGYAQFKTDQTITFENSDYITRDFLMEEFVHAVQFSIYGTDILSANRNIEFEAKVMQDIIAWKHGYNYGLRGAFDPDQKHDPNYFADYNDFIQGIALDNKPFNENDFQAFFKRWQGYPNKPQIDHLDPVLIYTFLQQQ